jgi:stearoyl-CoA desaturase (delta-9 desaturase)
MVEWHTHRTFPGICAIGCLTKSDGYRKVLAGSSPAPGTRHKYSMAQIIFTLVATHLTIICVTLYLHRGMAHRSLDFHPILSHSMRFWLWLTTGMVTRDWVAIHRKHHRFTDEAGDPHSPHVYGIKRVFFGGTWLYRDEAKTIDADTYGAGTPSDWIEKRLYSRFPWLGLVILLGINLWLFGPLGLISFGVQLIWIPVWAAGFINGIGHWFGYRNWTTSDFSRNVVPVGILIGGEELHNNHHKSPASAKLSHKWWEFDIGWFWIRILSLFRLLRVRKV